MSHYYRKIEIDHLDDIKTKCLEYIKAQEDIYFQKPLGAYRMLDFSELTTHCPELLTAFDRYNVKCKYAAAFVLYRNVDIMVHVDAGYEQARINIPLENCKNSVTLFYKGGVRSSYINPITGTEATRITGPGLQLVEQVEIDQPTVIRVKAPHLVRMDEAYAPRVTITLGFEPDIDFLLDA
jgi:hypothetical protein